MAFEEQSYIALCRQMIEKKFAFGNGEGYTQRNLQFLTQSIEDKTGIIISLSTLKRIWKDDYKQSPQITTLNALVEMLDYKDWQEFKMRNRPQSLQVRHRPNKTRIRFLGILVGCIGTTVLFFGLWMDRSEKIHVNGPVVFTADKTTTFGTPNTVVFNYDVSNVEADSFFIQQSWNPFYKKAIDPENNTLTSIYFESGYHRARLMANDSVIAMQPVHILSDGWEPHLYYGYEEDFIHFEGENFISDGQLHIGKNILDKRNVDFSRPFFIRIGNSRDFGVSSDHFDLVSRVKLDSVTGKPCPIMQVMIVAERHIFWVRLQKQGCERFAGYKIGEIERHGEINDLSDLGVNIYDWQEIGISVENKDAEIRINGRIVYQETFREDFGEVKGLNYIFDGTGSVDYVRLSGAGEESVFEEEFNGRNGSN